MDRISFDVALEIMSNLDYEDLIELCQVNSSWRRICQDLTIWKHLLDRKYPELPIVDGLNPRQMFDQIQTMHVAYVIVGNKSLYQAFQLDRKVDFDGFIIGSLLLSMSIPSNIIEPIIDNEFKLRDAIETFEQRPDVEIINYDHHDHVMSRRHLAEQSWEFWRKRFEKNLKLIQVFVRLNGRVVFVLKTRLHDDTNLNGLQTVLVYFGYDVEIRVE